MAGQFTLTIETEFAAAHVIRGHPGKCSRLHGHNWKVEVEVVADTLDELGMGVDFEEMKGAAREVTERLDHRHLNEISPFDRINPTAENVAWHLHSELSQLLNGPGRRVHAVTLKETDRASVRYTQ